MGEQRTRHILGLSGGKDSTALAIYLRDCIPNIEYVFCDTGKELPETYAYLDRLEAYLGQHIVRLDGEGRDFDHYLALRQINAEGRKRGFLPSARVRWCTELLKIRPLERYIGDDPAVSYVAIRADEDRQGYSSTKPNIGVRFPFKEDGINLADVVRILERSGLGLPQYYDWRSRSGCYFCFFQRKIEWVGLLERHPDLYAQATEYEHPEFGVGNGFTWCQNESLGDLGRPERVKEIKANSVDSDANNAHHDPRRIVDVVSCETITAKDIEEAMRSWET